MMGVDERREAFQPVPGTDAEMFIQWKGTDVCLDFHCPCQPDGSAFSSHFDGDFAYHLRCTRCGAIYEMGTQVRARRVEEADGPVQDLEYDDDVDDNDLLRVGPGMWRCNRCGSGGGSDTDPGIADQQMREHTC